MQMGLTESSNLISLFKKSFSFEKLSKNCTCGILSQCVPPRRNNHEEKKRETVWRGLSFLIAEKIYLGNTKCEHVYVCPVSMWAVCMFVSMGELCVKGLKFLSKHLLILA